MTSDAIVRAAACLQGTVRRTPLELNDTLSRKFDCQVWLKREDLQVVRSYKLRGAFHKMAGLSEQERQAGIVCASAGNHAQGVAYACRHLGIRGYIFMPVTTPRQKIDKVATFGGTWSEIVLTGDTFDDAFASAQAFCETRQSVFIHPFDDPQVIAGQGTVGLEIWEDSVVPPDFLFVPIGGGGLAAGVSTYFADVSPATAIVGVEPAGAAAMKTSLRNGYNTTLDEIDRFVDGAAVRRVGDLNFAICRQRLYDLVLIPEGKVCSTILKLYNEEAIVVEPAGALSVAALELYRPHIRGKTVVCIISGGNNDISRTEEIRERALLYEGLKHYFIIRFPQRAGALKEFVVEVLGPDDDIVQFEYIKKNNRESGPALIGIECKQPGQLERLQSSLRQRHFNFEYLNGNSDLLRFLV
ncbi:MAG: threonine ammonia-lyase IlvA [Saprospiraceae bacterium]|nr:threonine ammonia-lyase IlvA [Saprospiraceae bacterium]